MRNFRENTKPLCRSIPARSKKSSAVIADLRWKLADLTRRLWGKSSEKRHLPEDAGQLSICFESPSDVNDPVAEEQKTAGKSVTSENGYNRFRKSFTKKITPHARKPIDPSLPREEIIIPMPEGLSLEGGRSWRGSERTVCCQPRPIL